MDVRYFGYILKGIFGDPTTTDTKASGTIQFSGEPSNGDTLTLGPSGSEATWTFVSGVPSGNETQIQGTLAATLTQLVSDLNGSADTTVDDCTYDESGGDTLTIEYDVVGTGGNTWGIAASITAGATLSGSTLLGGGYSHAFTSGGSVPSMTFEVGHPALPTPKYFRHTGTVLGGFSFPLSRGGPADAEINLIAQQEAEAGSTIDGAADTQVFGQFMNASAGITKNATTFAAVVGGNFEFSNNLDAVKTIRDDGLIDEVQAQDTMAKGAVEVRFGPDTGVDSDALTQTPAALSLTFTTGDGWTMSVDLPRVFFPRRPKSVDGPGGIQANYEFEGERDDTAGYTCRVTLVNDVATY